tara:strand:- start:347 stop:661 length:315 start_codon:yes stop_codon:yes gene_type:complete
MIKLKKSSYKYIILITTIISEISYSQVLIKYHPESKGTLKLVEKILIETMELPKKLFKIDEDKNCKITAVEKAYDLAICVKKNGKIIFPVYKKAILQNSYKEFF